MSVRDLAGVRVLAVLSEGPPLATAGDWTDLIGEAMGEGADMIAVPTARLDEGFFRLSTRLAGEVIQKAVNYRLRLAIIGDIAAHVAASTALADFVRESNRGEHVWFVADWDALEAKLTPR